MMISAALLFARFTGILKRIPWQIWMCLAVLAALFMGARFTYNEGHDAGRFKGRAEMQVKVDAEIAAHKATKDGYIAAQAEAARLQDAKIAAEIARQERITDAVRQDYSRRLADSRANAGRLLAQARGAGVAGAASGVQMPAVAEAAAGIDAKADCENVFAGYVAGRLAPLEARIDCGAQAEKQALDHDALITWLEMVGGETRR